MLCLSEFVEQRVRLISGLFQITVIHKEVLHICINGIVCEKCLHDATFLAVECTRARLGICIAVFAGYLPQ